MKKCETLFALRDICTGCGETKKVLWTPAVTVPTAFCLGCLLEVAKDLEEAQTIWDKVDG